MNRNDLEAYAANLIEHFTLLQVLDAMLSYCEARAHMDIRKGGDGQKYIEVISALNNMRRVLLEEH